MTLRWGKPLDPPEEVDPTSGMTDMERARSFFGPRLREDPRLGYQLDGDWVRAPHVVDLFLKEAGALPRPRTPKPQATQRRPILHVRVDVAVTDDIRLRLVNMGFVPASKSDNVDALRAALARILRERLSG